MTKSDRSKQQMQRQGLEDIVDQLEMRDESVPFLDVVNELTSNTPYDMSDVIAEIERRQMARWMRNHRPTPPKPVERPKTQQLRRTRAFGPWSPGWAT